jgi:hypothetical protein
MKCSNCSSENIEVGVAWGKSAETGNLGLKYSIGILAGVSQVYADLCNDCGTVVRIYIKDTTDRDWIKTPGSLGSK